MRDPARAQFDELLPGDPMIIDDGIWVYYGTSIDPRSFTPLADRPQ